MIAWIALADSGIKVVLVFTQSKNMYAIVHYIITILLLEMGEHLYHDFA